MKSILVTAIGGDISQSIAKIIRESDNNVRLLGVDMHCNHGGTLFVDEFIKVPPATDANYVDYISNIVNKHNVEVILPVTEVELVKLLNTTHNLNLIHCGKKIFNIGIDKLKTIQFLSQLGIEIPWTVDSTENDPLDLPCIIKPRNSFDPQDLPSTIKPRGFNEKKLIFDVRSKKDVMFFKEKYHNAVFQELLEPYEKEITCAVYRTRDAQVATVQFERLLIDNITVWAKVIYDDKIDDLLLTIANAFDLNGSINVQLRLTAKGPIIFEINPRFSSTVLMRHKLGFSDVIWSLNEFYNQHPKLTNVKPGKTIVRIHNAACL